MPIPIVPEVTQGPQLKRIDQTMGRLPQAVYLPLSDLTIEAWITPEPVRFEQRRSGQRKVLKVGDVWGKLWDCAWMHVTGVVPEKAAGKSVVLLLDVAGEGCVFDLDGIPVQGLTSLASGFDYSLGRPGKRVVPVANPAYGGEVVDLWIDAASNDLFGQLTNGGALVEASIATRNEELQALCFDFEVLRELLDYLPKTKARYAGVLSALYKASKHLAGGLTDDVIRTTRQMLAPALGVRGGDPSLTVSAVGHAHIDLAWLWPLRESIRKGARTFSTALRMMERYPDYIFGASQPQLFQWIKEFYPDLYAQVKQRVAEGRWELQGAMWVEPDANIPSGESLVRQILYGKQFFQQEFGVDVTNLWMPDVFGYSGSLPQILVKSGLSSFLTQKLSWSEFNTFPHHTFHWEGIDGSRLLVHMPPEGTYNSSAAPRAVARAEDNYLDKDASDRCLMLFGIGDGGGGPGEEHLERLAREKDLQGLAPVVQESAAKFFERLGEHSREYATWRGELYLEKHQGTLTSQARSKWWNRKIEVALRELEFSAAQAYRIAGQRYPSEQIERIWKEMLLYQFHDILPGSSITRVYDESLVRYGVMAEEIKTLTAAADKAWVADQAGAAIVVNSLSWDRREWMKINDDWRYVSAPPLGCGSVAEDPLPERAMTASAQKLESELLKITFNDAGDLISIYDKPYAREILRDGQMGNVLSVYDDMGGDAWDFAPDYRTVTPKNCDLIHSEVYIDGPRAILQQTRRVNSSTLTQRIILTSGSRRIDFETHADWRESNKMLRTCFPVAVRAEFAQCEIQFGNIARPTTQNTSWEAAKFEVCGQKWVDLSEKGYGVALLNDCKYGHYVQGSVLDLNLLRSPSYPDPAADRAEHDFTYSLFPHSGDYAHGGVVRAAYEFNMPLRLATATGRSPGPDGCLLNLNCSNVVVETVKQAERRTESDGATEDIIVRMYEAHGASADVEMNFGFDVETVKSVNLLEQEEAASNLRVEGRTVKFPMKPFEITSLRIRSSK